MYLVWHGTAAIELVCQSGRILFDPFVPLQGSKVEVKIEEYDGFSDIFISHGHFDHIYSLPEIVQRNPEVSIHCTKTPYTTLVKKGVPKKNLLLMEFGQSIQRNGFTINTFHGKHAVLPNASLKRLWYAFKSAERKNLSFILHENMICRENSETIFFHIEAEGKNLIILGSMNLQDNVEYPVNPDLLVMPYCGWEDNFSPAVRIIEQLKPKLVLLDHYDDTFPPVTMPQDLSLIQKQYPGRVYGMKLKSEEQL